VLVLIAVILLQEDRDVESSLVMFLVVAQMFLVAAQENENQSFPKVMSEM
jgi:hypothetical protein